MSDYSEDALWLAVACFRRDRAYDPCSDAELLRALRTVSLAFPDHRPLFWKDCCWITAPDRPGLQSVDLEAGLLFAVLIAHRHFGDVLPPGLLHKLTNPPQIDSTIFELSCLAYFSALGRVEYEPCLPTGAVPDLRLTTAAGRVVYVECKSQSVNGSEHASRVRRVSNRIHSILDPEISKVAADAWRRGLRLEVRPSRTPSESDLLALEAAAATYSVDDLVAGARPSPHVALSAVDRTLPIDRSQGHFAALAEVGTTPQPLFAHEHVRVVIQSWTSLAAPMRRSQRALLADARRKLESMPEGAIGLVCMSTFQTDRFKPDVRLAVERPEFRNVPMVWLNPLAETGTLICRDDSLEICKELFNLTGRDSLAPRDPPRPSSPP